MDQHLTIGEARELTGRSESTIKRLLREITANRDHPERAFVLPAPDEVDRKKAAKEPYAWKIHRQLLLRRFPPESAAKEGSETSPQPAAASQGLDAVIQVLQDQLHSKDEQIRTLEKQLDRKDEQIAHGNERLRESNVLMRELQQRLSIAAPQAKGAGTVVEAVTPPSKPGKQPVAPPKKKPTAAPKRGILARLFGRK